MWHGSRWRQVAMEGVKWQRALSGRRHQVAEGIEWQNIKWERALSGRERRVAAEGVE